MPAYKYLIVGGGLTADSAVRGIRQIDSTSSIGIITQEEYPPYNRPMLSKGLWTGKPLERIWRKTEELGVDIHLGKTVQSLDLTHKTILDTENNLYSFDKLLLATGGSPRQLFPGNDDVINYRSLADYYKLEKLTKEKQNFLVIGGGFTGSEIAAALAMNDKKVTMAFPEAGIGARVFPHSLSLFLNDFYRNKNVEVLGGRLAKGIEKVGTQLKVRVHNQVDDTDQDILADGVIAGVGILPNVELARDAGLEVGDGIVVDEMLRTKHPDVYAAGDVASFFNLILKKRMRAEHEDNALHMGMTAGKNMAGENSPYNYLPFFYSDLFELGYEAVGELDSRKETVVDWKLDYKKGVIYYLTEEQVRGVLLWDVWGQVDTARDLLASGHFNPNDLIGRIS
jgi:3-phenylpropionate/trans-cinnamate dioxygenase ferredoxin reductase component